MSVRRYNRIWRAVYEAPEIVFRLHKLALERGLLYRPCRLRGKQLEWPETVRLRGSPISGIIDGNESNQLPSPTIERKQQAIVRMPILHLLSRNLALNTIDRDRVSKPMWNVERRMPYPELLVQQLLVDPL